MISKSLISSALLVILATTGCSVRNKLVYLDKNGITPSISPSFSDELPLLKEYSAPKDTLKVEDLNGNEVIIMKAIRGDDGEMVATDVIDAARVTAKFRNVAERHGKVDLSFLVTIPSSMRSSKWQIRLTPLMSILDQIQTLDPIIITGDAYRKSQIKGYEAYAKFLSSIITDSTMLIHQEQLELWIQRYLPEVFEFKNDSTEISEEYLTGLWGISQKEAMEHFTKKLAKKHNDKLKGKTGRMYEKLVKVPIVSEGIKLDTVMTNQDGDFIYEYVQTINTKPNLRKVDIELSGGIYEQDTKVWDIPKGDSIPFYISSISTLSDDTVRYLKKIISRRVEASEDCNIEFASGKFEIDTSLGDNSFEIDRIKKTLLSLIVDSEFVIDSITISASCSPEGRYASNKILSQRRSESVSEFFGRYIKETRQSIKEEEEVSINLDDSVKTEVSVITPIRMISGSIPEDWELLSSLVEADSVITENDKQKYLDIIQIKDLDTRELSLSRQPFYTYVRDSLYPKLRAVRFRFNLHRKGMVQDTIETTVIDSVYLAGVQAIRDKDYETALSLLRPYRDFNTAVAYCSLDYNASAIDVLNSLDRKDDKTEYLLALLHSRRGDTEEAVQHYINACRLNPSMVYRGNLDPEISSLISLYNLHLYEDDEEYFY